MKFLLLLFFIPSLVFSQPDSTAALSPDDVLKIADDYQKIYGFKKDLSLSPTNIELFSGAVTKGVFLAITPNSLIILRGRKEEIIPSDSIAFFSIEDLPPNPSGFAAGFAFGTYASFFALNSSFSHKNGNYLQKNSIDPRLLITVLAGAGVGFFSEYISQSQRERFFLWQGQGPEQWQDIVADLSESQVKPRKFLHIAFTTAYVPAHLQDEADKFGILPRENPNYTDYISDDDQLPINLLRRASCTVSPSFLKGFEFGAAYMKLNEPDFSEDGMMNYADSAYSIYFQSELQGEAFYGIIGYSAEVFKNTDIRFGAGFGRSTMRFKQELRGADYRYYGKNFPTTYFERSGTFFSLLGLAEISYLYNEHLSLGLTGDYVWMNAAPFPAEPLFHLPERSMPFKTFSIGLLLGLNF